MQLIFLLLVVLSCVTATPTKQIYTPTGSKKPKPSDYAGKDPTCVSRLVPVSISAVNTKLLFPEPDNQYNATQFVQSLAQVNSSTIRTANGGSNAIAKTYNISTTLCWPAGSSIERVHTLQILVHGLGLDKSYWDMGPGYSYVDAAVSAGYATLAYDRLGVGLSDHPDPIHVVQAFVDVEIQHALVTLARHSNITRKAFKRVVGVGHSYGSIVSLGHTAKYPKDFDAVILTGMSTSLQYLGPIILALSPAVAALNKPTDWKALPYAYLIHGTAISYQQAFFHYPYFDIDVFTAQYARKQPYAIGQLLTVLDIFAPAPNFTGPIDVVLGQFDFVFCLGDCSAPTDKAAAVKAAFYPAASAGSQSYLVPNSGHILNAHIEAPLVFAQMIAFLKSNGL